MHPAIGFAVLIFGVLLCTVLWLTVPHPPLLASLKEGGFVERGSSIGYVVVAALVLTLPASREFRWTSALAALLLAGREENLHRMFTGGDSFLKLTYYTRGDSPLTEKLIAGGLVVIIAVLMARYAVRNVRPFLCALRQWNPAAWSFGFALFMLPVSKGLDTLLRFLRGDLGLSPTPFFAAGVSIFEEVLELFIPILLLLAIVQAKALFRLRVPRS